MSDGARIYFFGVDDATRARLRREYDESVGMMRLADLVSDEYERLLEMDQHQFWDNEYRQNCAEEIRQAEEYFASKAAPYDGDDDAA